MRDAEASKSRIHLLPENNNQSTFAYENNLESTRFSWIYKKKEFWNPLEKQEIKVWIFIDINNTPKTFTGLAAYLSAP